MHGYYTKLQSSFKQIKDFEIFEKDFDAESKNIKNMMFINNVIWNIKYSGIYISEKIKAQENSSKKISEKIEMIENKLEKNNQRMIEMMGIFLAVFSIVNINMNEASKNANIDKVITINVSTVISIIVLFGLIYLIKKSDKNK